MSRTGRRFIALLLALALMAAMPGGVGFMGKVQAEEATEKVQLDVPTNLRWGPRYESDASTNGKYLMNWEGVNLSIEDEKYAGWTIELYKDEEQVYRGWLSDGYYESYWDNETNQTVYTDVPVSKHSLGAMDKIFESGSYKFHVQARAQYDDETYQDSEWSQWSDSITYVRPEQELGIVTDVVWDGEKAGVCHFTPLEASEYFRFYTVRLYAQRNDGTWRPYYTYWAIYPDKDATVVDVDFSNGISEYGEGKYYVTVQAMSNDIDIVAHGRESEPSEILDTVMNAEKLSGILNSATDKSAVETKELLTSSADISAIQQAMQTDDTFREQIKDLESRYMQEQDISVEAPAVSETAKEYVNPDQVSVVGAAFNAAQGKAVNLQMDVTPEAERVPVYSGYKNNVQLDIKLVSDNAEVHDLEVPVSVTMPIPQGINVSQLVLLHRRVDGGTEEVPFHVNGDGTVTFTVTSFSTFVFAEQSSGDEPEPSEPEPIEPEPSEPEPTEPEPNKPVPSNPTSSPSQSSVNWWLAPLSDRIEGAAPGSTVKVTKEQGIDTLSHDIMQLLVKRGDVSLDMEYTYEGKDYHIFIPAGKAVDNDIHWYGPLYLAAYFSNTSTVGSVSAEGTYVVQKGDTLSKIAYDHRTTVARLAAANPQITDVNFIRVGQVINIK